MDVSVDGHYFVLSSGKEEGIETVTCCLTSDGWQQNEHDGWTDVTTPAAWSHRVSYRDVMLAIHDHLLLR
jgi:hypothetical protein